MRIPHRIWASPHALAVRLYLAVALLGLVVAPAASAPTDFSRNELPQLIRAASGKFRPVDVEQAHEARRMVEARMAELDRVLASHPDADGWKQYLLWHALQDELRHGRSPDPAELHRIRGRFIGNYVGLEHRAFTDLRQAIGQYSLLMEDLASPNLQQDFERHVEGLAESVEAYLADPSARLRQQIAQHLGWLERRNQAAAEIALVRQHLSRPNLVLVFPAQAINRWFHTQLDETGLVQDVVLGTRITGTERTTGTVGSVLVPSDEKAIIQVELNATSDGQTVGRNGPVRIYQDNRVELIGRKQIIFDRQGLRAGQAESDASMNSQVTGLGTTAQRCVADWMIRRRAWRRVARQKAEADCIVEGHQREQLKEKLNHDVDAQLAEGTAELNEYIFFPLERFDLSPRELKAQTRADRLEVVAQFASAEQLGAANEPVLARSDANLIFQIHQSAAENLLADLIGGKTFSLEQMMDSLSQLIGRSDRALRVRRDRSAKNVEISLNEQKPVSFRIQDGSVAVTLHGRRYKVDGQPFTAMNITIGYHLESAEGGVRAVRSGDPEIVRPGLTVADRHGFREVTLRTHLHKQLERQLRDTLTLDLFDADGRAGALADLKIVRMAAESGWLTAECEPQ